MTLYSLFPTELWEEENKTIDNEALGKIILEMAEEEPTIDRSNIGGWHSHTGLTDDYRFSNVVNFVVETFRHVFLENNYKAEMSFRIAGMWAIVNRQQHFNRTHIHDGCDWSFAYYVKAPEGSGGIVWEDPRVRKEMRPSSYLVRNFNNPTSHDIYQKIPSDGKLFIFPAWLMHFVNPNLSDKPRICISGNIVIS